MNEDAQEMSTRLSFSRLVKSFNVFDEICISESKHYKAKEGSEA